MSHHIHAVEDRESFVSALESVLESAAENDVQVEGALDVTTASGSRYEVHVTRIQTE
jgi:RNA binding exosome subunit